MERRACQGAAPSHGRDTSCCLYPCICRSLSLSLPGQSGRGLAAWSALYSCRPCIAVDILSHTRTTTRPSAAWVATVSCSCRVSAAETTMKTERRDAPVSGAQLARSFSNMPPRSALARARIIHDLLLGPSTLSPATPKKSRISASTAPGHAVSLGNTCPSYCCRSNERVGCLPRTVIRSRKRAQVLQEWSQRLVVED